MNRTILCITLLLSAAGFAALAQTPGTAFRECDVCPDMVVEPAGSYTMGSPESEDGRFPNESPQHTVTIPRAFAAGRFEITRGQFAVFVSETGYQSQGGNCWYWDGGEGKFVNDDPSKGWRAPGYTQSDGHPVVCMSWNDAKAYVAWLAQKTGSAWLTGDCSRRVERGGSWNSHPRDARSADRSGGGTAGRDFNVGFRVARTL